MKALILFVLPMALKIDTLCQGILKEMTRQKSIITHYLIVPKGVLERVEHLSFILLTY